ncbi:hypothetical protein [uncultured Tenacibaculum sp.]|uniref:hypothetical protein n=1 Tax=uncultured Tenacibaculum sp. TaxID=174713 RepID=UPI00262BF60A|nr:hypothetical protein [uncultured Tenacibaculum sp.]
MIRSSFQTIFNLEVTHTYYENNICKGLVYKPTKETQTIINKFFFKPRITDTGFGLYTDTKRSIAFFLNYLTEVTGETSFHFEANTLNPQFYQITDLPINKIGVIIYKSNWVIPSSKAAPIVLKSNFIPTKEANVVFKVSIEFKDIISQFENNITPLYQIKFKARATQWNYLVMNRSRQNLGSLSIESKSNIKFKGPVEVNLQNGEKAQRFTTDKELLKLTEIPKYSFDLISLTKKNGLDRTKIIFKGLPNPNPSVIEVNTNQLAPLVASLMYVYV